jgi:hypothetical protein
MLSSQSNNNNQISQQQQQSNTGTSSTSTSSSYPRSLFLKDSIFSPQEFIDSRLRSNGNSNEQPSLEQIESRLQHTVKLLTDELLGVINRDHQIFLELSGDLIRVDTTVAVLRGPLTNLKERVESVKRVLSAPLEAAKEFDEQIRIIQEEKQRLELEERHTQLKEKITKTLESANAVLGDSTIQQDHTSLLDLERAAQRLAALDYEDHDLKLNLHHSITERIFSPSAHINPNTSTNNNTTTTLDTTSMTLLKRDQLDAALRALATSNTVDAARRAFVHDLPHKMDRRTAIQRVLTSALNKRAILESCIDQGLSTVFEFLSQATWTSARDASGEILTIQDAKEQEALRCIFAAMSVSGAPHTTPRWNPRMHCELVFQEAVGVLGKSHSSRQVLDKSLAILFKDSQDMSDDVILISKLFRMGLRLIFIWLEGQRTLIAQGSSSNTTTNNNTTTSGNNSLSEPELIETVKIVAKLADDVITGQIFPSFVQVTLKSWNGLEKAYQLTNSHAVQVVSLAMNLLFDKVSEATSKEITTHENLVNATYRKTGKPLSMLPSPSLTKVLAPIMNAKSTLEFVPEDEAQNFLARMAVEIVNQFQTVVDKVVKREESLMNLHRKSAAAGNVMTDSEKIVGQLKIDAEEFMQQILQQIIHTSEVERGLNLLVNTLKNFGVSSSRNIVSNNVGLNNSMNNGGGASPPPPPPSTSPQSGLGEQQQQQQQQPIPMTSSFLASAEKSNTTR